MTTRIPMGSSVSIAAGNTGNLPQMGNALTDWFRPMRFGVVTKTTVNGQTLEQTTPIDFRGVIQPLEKRKLSIKPTGQQGWTWKQVHSDPSLVLRLDDIVIYEGVQYRVGALFDYREYGYFEYHLAQDYTGLGPKIV